MNEAALKAKDDEIFNAYINVRISWGSFMFDDAPRDCKIKTVTDLYEFADPLLWLRNVGRHDFPSMALLARIVLCRSEHGAFQESVFSSGGDTMTAKQTRMCPEQFEKKALLYHNRAYIRAHIHKF